MTERLEEIKNVYEDYKGLQKKRDFKQADIALLYLSENHIDWLIQQAERVEELEKVIGDLDENVAAFETLWLEEKRKNKRYKQALEFYAERDNYQWEVSYRPQQEIDCMVIDDSGHTARKALKGE